MWDVLCPLLFALQSLLADKVWRKTALICQRIAIGLLHDWILPQSACSGNLLLAGTSPFLFLYQNLSGYSGLCIFYGNFGMLSWMSQMPAAGVWLCLLRAFCTETFAHSPFGHSSIFPGLLF